MRKPGHTSSVTEAPPTSSRRSSTTTLRPARARYAAHTSPLWPPPTTIASSTLVLEPGARPPCLLDVSHPEARVRLQVRRVQPSRTQEVCAMATLVRHAMTESPQTAKPAMTAGDAAALMRQLDVGVIPVAQDGKLVGLVTDRDLALRVMAERKDPNSVMLGEIATKSPVTISPDAKLAEALELMSEHKVRRLPVMKGEELVG